MPREKKLFAASPGPNGEYAKVVSASDSTLPPNRRHSILWCFCALCGRQTEFAVACNLVTVYKRLDGERGVAKIVPLTDLICREAQKIADDLVARYEEAMGAAQGAVRVIEMLDTFCNRREMRGDISVDSFRDQVERGARTFVWHQHGDMFGAIRLPGDVQGAKRPSKLYCSLHQPTRNDAARRAYQRDRRFLAEYEELIGVLWSRHAADLKPWDVDDQELIRDAAYHALRLLKSPTTVLDEQRDHKAKPPGKSSIEDYYEKARLSFHRLRLMREASGWMDQLREKGVGNQTVLARHIRVSRQAVSAALKRRATVSSMLTPTEN